MANSAYAFAAEVIWETNKGEKAPDSMNTILECVTHCLFLPMYNEACDLLNPCYEEWNREFNEKHPDKDGYSREYNEFIANKSNEVLARINKAGSNFELRCEILEDDLCEVVGHFGGYSGYRCKVRIHEVSS